jgi:hypothetical protein
MPSRNASSSHPSGSRTPSGTRPARQRGPVWRIVQLGAGAASSGWRQGLSAGATSTAAIAAPVPMPPVATSGMGPGHAPTAAGQQAKGARRCPRQPAIGLFTSTDGKPWPSTPRGSSMGLIANDRQRGLGMPPAAGSLPITTYKSDWQISGKWRLEALRPVTGRVLDPA